ncbi:MAG: SpoIIE family protein phosphatase [Bacteroidetes bacterium]|nr:SpoIIE family protein phosphatase [Bacteroidota bacterium]
MQQKILPEKLPVFENYEVAAVFIPAFEVGGDYYDFFTLPNGITGFVIADVSGKGISAAFVMAELKGILESFSTVKWSPKEILVEANFVLKRFSTEGFLLPLFLVFLTQKQVKLP